MDMNNKEEKAKKIMIIDDDPDYLSQMVMVIEKFGFDVVTADSQKEGEELLENVKPDLAIVDLMMENRDSGFILSYKLKKKYPETPVILASAVTAETGMNFNIETMDDKRWIKADKFLEKGIRPDQLEREINKLLKI